MKKQYLLHLKSYVEPESFVETLYFDSPEERDLWLQLNQDNSEYYFYDQSEVEAPEPTPIAFSSFEHLYELFDALASFPDREQAEALGAYIDELYLTFLPHMPVKEASRKTLEALDERFRQFGLAEG